MGPLVIDALYQTSERSAIDRSCTGVRTGSAELDRCPRWDHLRVSNPRGCLSCVRSCRAVGVGAVSVGHQKVG